MYYREGPPCSGPVFVIKVNVLAKRITMSQANVRELAQ